MRYQANNAEEFQQAVNIGEVLAICLSCETRIFVDCGVQLLATVIKRNFDDLNVS